MAAKANDTYEDVGLKPREKPKAPETVSLAIGRAFETKAGEKRRLMLPDGSCSGHTTCATMPSFSSR